MIKTLAAANRSERERFKIPKSVQQSIPIQQIFRDGIWMVGGGRFSRTWRFADINYSVASKEDQQEMFLSYCGVLNSLPTGATAKITINNRRLNGTDFQHSVLMRLTGSDLDRYRREYNGILMEKATQSNNLIQDKYITISVSKKGIEEARTFFKRVDIDLSKSFGRLDSGAKPLDSHDRLRIFHDFFRAGEEQNFRFDFEQTMRRGHSFKDTIAPDGMQFFADHFEMGGKVGRVLFLREYASYIKDEMIAKLSDFPRNLMLSIDILPVPTNEAVKEMQARIMGVESDITRWQQKQNANNNFTAAIPYELEQLRAENKEFLDDLSTRDQRMIFANVTLVHMADTLEQLDADTETLQSLGNENLCQFSILRYQQEDGLNTALPYGLRRIKTTRTLTTESTAVLMPFRVQEIQDAGGIYYGVNAVSKNLLICNRKRLLNPHGFILGVSGSGKSFSMKEAITFIALSTNDDIIIIDAEREYGDLIRALGGAVIEISPNSPHHINPLEIARGYGTGENPVAMKSELLMSICEQQMGAGQLGAFHKSIIDRCTAAVYHDLIASGGKARQPILSDWRNEVKRQPEREAEELALASELFVEGSLNMFAHDTNVDIANRIISFDLYEMGEQLKPTALNVTLETIQNRVAANRLAGKYTWVFVDEVYLFFRYHYSAQFLYKCWKRFRKYAAAMTAATQNVEECLRSDTARLMFANSEFLVLLNQAATDRAELAKLLNISTNQMSYITSAEAGHGLIRVGGSIVPFANEFPRDKQGNRLAETDALGNSTRYTYDEQGRLAKVTYPNGSTASYEYTEAGKLVKTTDALGNTQTYTVDGNGFNTSESDRMGHITSYERNVQNQITKVIDPMGNETTYSYDDRGNMVVTTDANGNKVSYTYDATGRMLSMTDGEGNTWTYTYDNESRLTSVTDPLGGVTSTSYNEVGRTTKTTDANGAKTSYTYDGVGNTTAVKDALGKSTKYTYDANGNMTSMTNRKGDTWTYTYDANNRLTSETDPLGGVTTYTYDELGNVTQTVTPGEAETAVEYDSMSRPVVVTNALGFDTQYEYDALGRVTTITNPDGTSVNYTYDANGMILTATDEMGGVVSYEYDANSRVTFITDAMGGESTLTYDGVGNVTCITDPMGFETGYTYNANNAIETVTDANGAVTAYTYDANGRVSTITDPNGGVTSYGYDAVGNVTSLTDAEGHTTQFAYDLLGRLTSITDARGNVWEYAYDAEGNLIQASDPLKNSISKSYDKLGQLVAETDRNGNTWKYTYDGDGRMTSKTDPLGYTITYTYDAEGQLLKETTALGRETSYTYDSMGRTATQTDPMDHVVTFYYDDLGQLTGLTNKDGTDVAYTYDANGNNLTVTDEEGHVATYTYDADGRMTKLHNAKGYDTKYEYDDVGNLVKVTDAMDGVTSYDYDANGNLLSVTNTDGYTTSYTYDKLGQVLTITDPEGGVTAAEYDGNGNIVKITQANGKSISYTYDKADRLISYVDAEGYTTEFSYDGNGNVISVTDGNGNVTHYTYDGLDRLVGRTDAEGGSASKTYDADGRLVQVVDEEGAVTKYAYDDCDRVTSMTNAEGYTTTYTYDEMDRVLTITDPRKGVITYTYTDRGDVASVTDQEGYVTSFAYDENRNLVKMTTLDGDTILTYDPLDRIIAITTPDGETEQIAYNGEGQVVSTTDKSGHTTKYILDGNGQVVETIDALGNSSLFEYDAMGNLTKTSLHRVDAQNGVDEWEITTYEYDGRGLATKTTDALGNVTSYTYDGNGNLASKTDADNYTTQYTYNGLDMITHINYNGGKQVEYAYNAVGDLVRMEDWTGVNTFEYDLLSQLKKVTDHKGNVVEYDYDGNGNQTAITYPDGTVAAYTYDKVNNLTSVTESEGTTTYQYDGMGRAARMEYPNGWVEEYTYDNMGRLVKVTDTDPFQLYNKTPKVKYEYKYDANGNVIYEFQRDSDAEENLKSHTDYTYDALDRLTGSTRKTERYPNESAIRTYTYDSLGNMIRETGPSSLDRTSYQYNSLNQLTAKEVCSYVSKITMIHDYGYTYDGRGNLVKEEEICSPTTQGPRNITIGTYLYDETNRMVQGANKTGEASLYTFNGLGVRVGSELILEDNTHGYTDFHCQTPSIETTVGGPQGPEVVKADYVIDYTRLNIDQRVLMKLEEGGYDFRYVYGLDKVQVTVNSEGSNWWGQNIKPCVMMNYVHTDRLGSVVNLSDQYGRVTARADYDDWGKVTAYTDITVDGGFRRLLPEITYATHEYDDVLGQFYAKARMYDAGDRRFTAMDPVKGNVFDSISMVQYLYVANNPIIAIDLLGLWYLKQDKNGNYFASAESYGEGFLKTFDFLGNAITSSGNMFTNWKNGYKVVGGNSTNKYNSAIDIISGYVEDKVKDTVKEEAVEKVFGSAMKDFIGPIDQLYDTITFFDRLEKNISIPKYDYIAFHLLDLAKISPEGPDMDRVTLILDSAYLFIETMNWFFTAPVYTTFHRTALGGGVVLPSPTVFESLTVLSNMKKSGKATSEINAKINEYYNSFLCGNKSSNPVMSQVVEISDFSGTYLSSLYYQYLINYDSILGVVVNGFKEFMSGILNYYDSSVA